MDIFCGKSFLTKRKLRGKASLYRMAGIIGSGLTLLQACIWIVLCVVAILYYEMGAPFNAKSQTVIAPYGYILSQTYFDKNNKLETCAHLTAQAVFYIVSVYLGLSFNLFISCIFVITAFKSWTKTASIRHRAMYWMISIILMSLYELLIASMFFMEYLDCVASEQYNVAAAAATMATLSMKGFLMWAYNLSLALIVICIQCCECDECPVSDPSK